ncbi:MAG: hypothetical protein KBD37_02845 [Burkholderiales bacterium]|nr:hypothetical protein [Burkholderiales bacterium]
MSFSVGYASADNYISYNNYIQNPFNGQPTGGGTQIHLIDIHQNTGGGTQVIYESEIMNQNAWQKWFNDGTYNIQAAAAILSTTSNSVNFSYGSNIFVQTGSAAGFSFGGNLAIINPYFSPQINGTNPSALDGYLPANQVVFPNELFTEYKLPNLLQIDAGWLYINTPWVTSVNSEALQQPTYQGILLNYQMTANILWTAMALNGYMPISATGFSGLTLYNQNFNTATQTPNIHNYPSPGTIALGMQYGNNTLWKSSLWGYQFQDYANLLYGDTKYILNIDPRVSYLTFAAQAAVEGANGANVTNSSNAFASSGYGTPQSNMIGLQFGVNYDWLGFFASYNSVFGNSTAYQSGGLVSPYTYQYGIDPMYTSSLLGGLIEKSAGSALKLGPSFTFFDKTLMVAPSFTQFWTSPYPSSTEWDMVATYNLPQVRGLSFNGFFGYLQQPVPTAGGNITYAEVLTSYVY